jgi:pyruvate formate lyase activating enzyme
MRSGVVFDIKEFAVHDGPGIRVAVFLKGCPLRCAWCHNPEGLLPDPQALHGAAGPRTAGSVYGSQELAERLNGQADLLRAGEGGVTFSGGEPLAQAAFVAEVIDQLDRLHVLLDTSGCAEESDFRLVAGKCDCVYFDVKLIDSQEHRRYTGVGNEQILHNLRVLCGMGVPFVIRVPLIPGVTDTKANLAGIARLAAETPGAGRVDMLPYNKAAGGKYAACGMTYQPGFDETRELSPQLACFETAGIEVRIL